jgi:hypothetical protein
MLHQVFDPYGVVKNIELLQQSQGLRPSSHMVQATMQHELLGIYKVAMSTIAIVNLVSSYCLYLQHPRCYKVYTGNTASSGGRGAAAR